jgi:hypothetical protein
MTKCTDETSSPRRVGRPIQADSRPTQLAALEVNGSISVSEVIDIGTVDHAGIVEIKRRLGALMRTASVRAAKAKGYGFSTITGEYLDQAGKLVVVATTFRTN